jgi:hypothetical protein
MKSKEAFSKMSKEQTLHLIVYMMFVKNISLEELTALIKDKEREIVIAVGEHLNKGLGG